MATYAEDGPDEECTVRETCHTALANAVMVLAQVADKKIRVSAKTGGPRRQPSKRSWSSSPRGDWYDKTTRNYIVTNARQGEKFFAPTWAAGNLLALDTYTLLVLPEGNMT